MIYMDNGRSILRFFFLANLTCFVIFMHKSNSIVTQTKIKASRIRLKYRETAEKTRKARIMSSHIINTRTSILQAIKGREGIRKVSISQYRKRMTHGQINLKYDVPDILYISLLNKQPHQLL